MASSTEEIHRITVDDGAEIAGRVYGEGPPVVFIPGAMEDGPKVFGQLAKLMSRRHRCYLMDTRGMGLSSDHSDMSPERLVRDVVDYVESIGRPTGLFGESGGGIWSLGAAAQTDLVESLALYEPAVLEVQSREAAEDFRTMVDAMKKAVAQGEGGEAARMFLDGVYNEQELQVLEQTDYFAESAGYVEAQIRRFDEILKPDSFSPSAPSVLDEISVPVLLMRGTASMLQEWMVAATDYLDEHLADARHRLIDGGGHGAPALEPESIAEELGRFFNETTGTARPRR